MKNPFVQVSDFLTVKAADVTAKVCVNLQRRKPIPINQKAYLVTLAMLTICSAANAQGPGRVAAGMSQLAQTMITIVNYLLPALVIVGIVICVFKAIRDQDFGSYAMGVLAALLVWGGLNAFKDDIFGMFGGQTNLQIEN